MKPQGLREREERLLNQAKERCERNQDGSINETDLIDQLANMLIIDIDVERRRKAAVIIDQHKRPGTTEPAGQLLLPGFNSAYDWEPNRLVADDAGNVIENSRATPRFKAAETARSRENASRAFAQLQRKDAENDLFQRWSLDEALQGRPARDLTWGNCVLENNLRLDLSA